MNVPLQSMGDSPLNHLRRWENGALVTQTQTWDLFLCLTPLAYCSGPGPAGLSRHPRSMGHEGMCHWQG